MVIGEWCQMFCLQVYSVSVWLLAWMAVSMKCCFIFFVKTLSHIPHTVGWSINHCILSRQSICSPFPCLSLSLSLRINGKLQKVAVWHNISNKHNWWFEGKVHAYRCYNNWMMVIHAWKLAVMLPMKSTMYWRPSVVKMLEVDVVT